MQVVNLHTQPLKSRSRPATCSAPAGMRSPTHLRCVSSLLKRFGAPLRGTSLTGFCACLRSGCSSFRNCTRAKCELGRHTGCQPVLRGGREGLPVPGSRRCFLREARMAKRRKHRASGGQDARSERPAMGTGSPELRERLRINCYQDQFPAPKGSLPAAGAVAGVAAGFAVAGARGPAAWPSRSMAANACFIAAASGD